MACPELEVPGWHPLSGTEERQRALSAFKLDLSEVNVHDKERWYLGENPWHAAKQAKWKLENMTVIESTPTTTAVAKTAMKVATSTFEFYNSHYVETVKLPVLGRRTTKWVVCCYVTPTQRLLRRIDGFVGKGEEEFLFALSTVRILTVSSLTMSTTNLASRTTPRYFDYGLPGLVMRAAATVRLWACVCICSSCFFFSLFFVVVPTPSR